MEYLKADSNNDSSDTQTEKISANEWSQYFSELGTVPNTLRSLSDQLNKKLEATLGEFSSKPDSTDCTVSTKEIMSAIKTPKNGKAAGLDGIKNEMLEYSCHSLLGCLLKLFKTITSCRLYPSNWSIGFITPIYKGGGCAGPNNYRSITITSCVGKPFNAILNRKLETILTDNDIICREQIGFTEKCRTSDHVFVLKTLIDKYAKHPGGKLYTCFVDFRKAFETVIHSALFTKVIQYNITGSFLDLIRNIICIATQMFQSNLGN